jgi:surfactin synthase thioesterase subunit
MYQNWPEELRPEIEICPVQLAGREDRCLEEPYSRMGPLVEALAEALQPYLNIPFAFVGHSLGAVVCFEMVRQLRRQGLPLPAHLFVSGAAAPQLANAFPQIHRLPAEDFLDELKRLNGTPDEVLQNAELMDVLLPALRADFELFETYIHAFEYPLPCPITASGGQRDVRVSHGDLAAWRLHTTSTFRVRLFPGNHFFIRTARKPLLRTMLHDLQSVLGV